MAVYFIQVGETGPVKIGFSVSPLNRLRDLQTASGSPLRLIAAFGGALSEEARLHIIFGAHRMSGEWFEPHPDILAYAAERGVTLPAPAPEPEPPARSGVREVAASYEDLIPPLVKTYGVAQIAAWAEMTPRGVENWRDGTSSPNLAAFLALAKHVPEIRAWIIDQLDYGSDPTRALAVIANALARRQP